MKKLFAAALALCCMTAFAQRPVVAVAPFDAISGVSAADANAVTRLFFGRLGNTGRVILVDRDMVDRVLREHRFQTGDWSNTQKTAELGSALNANWIVRGGLEKFGSNILLTVQFYDLNTFQFMGSSDTRFANMDDAYDKMDPLVNKLIETIGGTGARPGGGRQTEYKIGDRGPAGGWVFYDKGVFSGGWRYLEAAPAETEFIEVQWGANGKDVSGTAAGIGRGKQNTELIVNYLRQTGESGRAAQLCAALNYDGFKDWFLPSIDELDLMYKNLKQKGLGGFSNDSYWSSLQYSTTHAWYQSFSYGYRLYSYSKNWTRSVRAVRAF